MAGAAVGAVAEAGGAAGVTALEATDTGPVPTALIACTVNLYDVPLVRPGTVAVVTLPTVTSATGVVPPVVLITKPVIGEPPSDAGAVKDTVADPFPATADRTVTAPGRAAVGPTVVGAATSLNASHSLVTASLWMQNRRFSTFHSVSMPSP